MSWTQPLCGDCYAKEHPGQPATYVRNAEGERCALCGAVTFAGIYVRRDPATVPYPMEDS